MSHTIVRLCHLAWSLVAVLTSADGRRAFMPGLRRLPRLNPSRRVSCTNPRTNLVTAALAVPTQMPSWDGGDVSSLALPSDRIRDSRRLLRGSIRRHRRAGAHRPKSAGSWRRNTPSRPGPSFRATGRGLRCLGRIFELLLYTFGILLCLQNPLFVLFVKARIP